MSKEIKPFYLAKNRNAGALVVCRGFKPTRNVEWLGINRPSQTGHPHPLAWNAGTV
jgi:hypothetical protein